MQPMVHGKNICAANYFSHLAAGTGESPRCAMGPAGKDEERKGACDSDDAYAHPHGQRANPYTRSATATAPAERIVVAALALVLELPMLA